MDSGRTQPFAEAAAEPTVPDRAAALTGSSQSSRAESSRGVAQGGGPAASGETLVAMSVKDYARLVDSLAYTWDRWGSIGTGLTAEQWLAPSRCIGWDVAALYAHHSAFPLLLSSPQPDPDTTVDRPVRTAADVLRGFNVPGGVATTMASAVAQSAAREAQQTSADVLVGRFTRAAPLAARQLQEADPQLLLPWPGSGGLVPLREGLRIVLLEATVHLLDVGHALQVDPAVPDTALHATVRLLAELASPTEFIDHATGRSGRDPLPVLR